MRKQSETQTDIMVMLARAGMSKAELARNMGITPQRIGQMIRDEKPQAIARLKAAIREASND